jgi:hypothetical protein
MPLIHPLVLDQSFQMSVKRYGSLGYICSGICLLQSLLIFLQEGLVLSQKDLITDGLQFHQLFGRAILGGRSRSLPKKMSIRYIVFRSISVAISVAGNGNSVLQFFPSWSI